MNAMQCKMARVALGLGVRELASLADVAQATVSRLERGEELKAGTVQIIRAALEGAGVIFVESNGEGEGVRMRKLREGDKVKLVKGTSTWGAHQNLQGKIGVVIDEVADGTSTHRISVSFDGEEIFTGTSAGAFEHAGSLSTH
ncbi:helix-turn-helix domain-containing protein [Parasedimentitalea psychrophila]|uniref:Helix-turn-helix transcriptional regulator n=1 Tax=Parasedimentitalea psychrophila TaxID=2997337 RepID=A0A9Y2P8D5_9RHOB|nr:helix-turn-helix transcriptional regulator [Parasedimentitalea psychrophila]WIY26958.1 helix-turn-helix transcriptional regulator [Parasedimentitalea psychrophila]